MSLKSSVGAVPGLPDGVPAAVTTVPDEAAPAVAVRGEEIGRAHV